MNIKEAKQEIKNAVGAYLKKDENGKYLIDERFCRPLLLIGPPGIGKTAIMSQIANELSINLISYTITHHTRQSAIGLPVVEKKVFGGTEYSVTEYTMSEIIASVYEKIEETGISEGILFLDEINCVSETLLPTMLQFLQYKTFGTHKVPRSFVICCAGNPPKYNRSAREFDIVTLDRTRRLNIEADAQAFLDYAVSVRMHGAITAFLDIKKDRIYRVTADIEETHFVTARSWEDLSVMISAYESNGIEISAHLISEYIGDPEIAEEFFGYYGLYEKYRSRFAIADILSGSFKEGGDEIANAPFDEKLSLIHLLLDALALRFEAYRKALDNQLSWMEKIKSSGDDSQKAAFNKAEDARQDDIEKLSDELSAVFLFLDRTFGEGQEMVLFLVGLGRDPAAKAFLSDCGNEYYEKYASLLLLHREREGLRHRIRTTLNSNM